MASAARTEAACLADAFSTTLERRAYDYGRMESNVRSALNQLEHGNTELALASLRRAVAIAEERT